jgi:hypothetical protein
MHRTGDRARRQSVPIASPLAAGHRGRLTRTVGKRHVLDAATARDRPALSRPAEIDAEARQWPYSAGRESPLPAGETMHSASPPHALARL